MKFWHEGSAIIPFAVKYNLTILSYPLNRFEKNSIIYLTTTHIVLGEQKHIDKYFADISKNPKYTNLEREGNVITYTLKAKKGATHLQLYLSPELIFVKPIVIKPDGFEYAEIAALQKSVLTNFLKNAQKWLKIEVQKISQEKIRDIYVPHIMPEFTEKQKQVITLAYKNGYYSYPRQIEIKRLAKIAGLSPSTFQEHLHKAEQKLIPFFLENIMHQK